MELSLQRKELSYKQFLQLPAFQPSQLNVKTLLLRILRVLDYGTTTPNPTTSTGMANVEDDSEQSKVGLIAGVACAGVGLLACVILVLVFVVRRKRTSKKGGKERDIPMESKAYSSNTAISGNWEIEESEIKFSYRVGAGAFGQVFKVRKPLEVAEIVF